MKAISKWSLGIFSLFVVVGLIGLMLWLLNQVMSGQGNVPFISHRGYQWTPIGALSAFLMIPVLGLVAWYLRYRQTSIEKDFIKKYGAKNDKSQNT